MVASIRIVVRNESNKPEFLMLVFEDITDRRSLSKELESTKKFLELVVDNIPVALIVEQVKDGRYLLANRSAETILNRRREEATGLTASDIFNPKEAKLIIARDEAAIKKRGMITEEHPISTKDGLRLFLTRRATVLERHRRAAISDQDPRGRHRSPARPSRAWRTWPITTASPICRTVPLSCRR